MKYNDGSEVSVNTKYTWSTYPIGDWGTALALNEVRGSASYTPALAKQYRHSTNKRVFFASWETYFLIAEAALRGWATPINDQAAYERGIKESFDYNNVGQFYASYISSTEYSRVGTSVSYSHTTEPELLIQWIIKTEKQELPVQHRLSIHQILSIKMVVLIMIN